MKNLIPIYQVDAFTSKAFNGNPAAVCILEENINNNRVQLIGEAVTVLKGEIYL